MNEEQFIKEIALECRNSLFNRGIHDISTDSIVFSMQLLHVLVEYNIDAIAMTGWLEIGKNKHRVCYMYIKVNLKNGRRIYIDALSGEKVVYNNNKVRSMKKYQK